MKPILIIIACLLSWSAMAQKLTIDTAKFKSGSMSTQGYKGLWNSSSYKSQNIKYISLDPNEVILSVSNPDSVGNRTVWINRKQFKRITWTSDSTFTLSTKP